MKKENIKVEVAYTDGWLDRYAAAVVKVAEKKEKQCEDIQQKRTS